MELDRFQSYRDKVVSQCGKVILGKESVIQMVLTAFLASGHVLLEDVPGTGKTMLLRAFAKTIGGGFNRIQFTPDLLPSDLTGINYYNQKSGDFEFRPGPLFANIILADEINRATPRTQSSLLEAMEERQITVDGTSYPLEEPFMVMATQNPLESYGTFPLPEAQTDRFFMRLSLGYMTRSQEMEVMARRSTLEILDSLEQAVTPEETRQIRESFHQVKVEEPVLKYMMDIIEATRKEKRLAGGVSTRGAIALYKASQLTAAFAGRSFVIPEDVKTVTLPVLGHRISRGSASEAAAVLDRIIEQVPVPLEQL